MSNSKLKNIVEGFIFASNKALNEDNIIKMFPEGEQPDKEEVVLALQELEEDFRNHGVELKKVSSGYRFQVREKYSQWISRLWEEKPQKYTRALLETLALIVYRQPITRGEIEEIRGVSVSSNIIKTLLERDWIKSVGHRDVPGRPALFASTKLFLDYFNLQSLEDLPPLSEIKDLDAIATELDPEQNAALIEAIREMQRAQKDRGEAVERQESAEAELAEQKPAESVETIAAEIEQAIAEEDKLDVAEAVIEAELIEQTEHEAEFLQQQEETAADKFNEEIIDEISSENENENENENGKVGEV